MDGYAFRIPLYIFSSRASYYQYVKSNVVLGKGVGFSKHVVLFFCRDFSFSFLHQQFMEGLTGNRWCGAARATRGHVRCPTLLFVGLLLNERACQPHQATYSTERMSSLEVAFSSVGEASLLQVSSPRVPLHCVGPRTINTTLLAMNGPPAESIP